MLILIYHQKNPGKVDIKAILQTKVLTNISQYILGTPVKIIEIKTSHEMAVEKMKMVSRQNEWMAMIETKITCMF